MWSEADSWSDGMCSAAPPLGESCIYHGQGCILLRGVHPTKKSSSISCWSWEETVGRCCLSSCCWFFTCLLWSQGLASPGSCAGCCCSWWILRALFGRWCCTGQRSLCYAGASVHQNPSRWCKKSYHNCCVHYNSVICEAASVI